MTDDPESAAAASRRTFRGTSPYEDSIGFSRALRVGNHVFVSGTGPVDADGRTTPGEAGPQADRCFEIIDAAIAGLGGSRQDVVRTRMYLVDAADADAVGAAHSRWFGAVRPAATMVVVAALLRPEWRVEIEAEAVIAATDRSLIDTTNR